MGIYILYYPIINIIIMIIIINVYKNMFSFLITEISWLKIYLILLKLYFTAFMDVECCSFSVGLLSTPQWRKHTKLKTKLIS